MKGSKSSLRTRTMRMCIFSQRWPSLHFICTVQCDEDVNILMKVAATSLSVLCNVSMILSLKVGDVMHAVFSQYKAAWLPQFERLLPKVTIAAK